MPAWLTAIPASWPLKRLKFSLKSEKNGIWGSEPDGGEGDIPCIRVADFDRDHLVVTSAPTLRSVSANERNGRIVQTGDLLIEKSGGGETQPVGVVVQYTGNEPVVCSNFVARIPCVESVNPRFFLYVHAALYNARVNARSIKQTSGIQNLDTSAYFSELAPFPHLETQGVIAGFLDGETEKADALVAKYQHLIELLEEKRTALITHAVTKGLNPSATMADSGVEGIGEIPQHWNISPFKRVLREPMLYGATESGEPCVEGFPRYIRITDIDQMGRLHEDGALCLPPSVAKPYMLEDGDILFARSGATVGKAFLYEPASGPACFAGYLIRARADQSKILPQFIRYFASAQPYWEYIKTAQSQATIQNVNAALYAQMPIPVPSITEQRKIVMYLDAEMGKIAALTSAAQHASALVKEHRSALITAAITGQIDVRTYNAKDLTEAIV